MKLAIGLLSHWLSMLLKLTRALMVSAMDSLNLSSLREILNYSYTSICRMAYISAAKEWNGTVERKLDDDYRCQDDDEFNRSKDQWRDKKECRYYEKVFRWHASWNQLFFLYSVELLRYHHFKKMVTLRIHGVSD